jgi:predicted nucleic acid-binding protein
MPFSAMLDANVLVPNLIRDTLLRIAEAGFYRPLWSADILAETRRTILRIAPNADPRAIDRMLASMDATFMDARVTGYEPFIPAMTNSAKDRHVLAAAVVGRADAIVSADRRGFPTESCAPFDIEAVTPDTFLINQYDLDPEAVVEILRQQSAATGRIPGRARYGVPELLAALHRTGAPRFADAVAGRRRK